MNREEFLLKYWQYYLALEDDFIKTTRYVELNTNNYKTFSIEYTKQYQAICSEIDVLCKEICSINDDNTSEKFDQYTSTILKTYTDITTRTIDVGLNSRITLKPFKDWAINPKYKSPTWWTSYNWVKHKRNINFKQANLGNVLNSLAGLYMLEKYLLKDICTIKLEDFDIPNKDSKIFDILEWETDSFPLQDIILSGKLWNKWTDEMITPKE